MPGPLTHDAPARRPASCRARAPSRASAGERLAASYVNFYIANGGIVMPLLDARTDRAAARRLKRLFPGRRVRGCAGAGDPARRRQYPLHHAADPARNANPITVCPLSPKARS